MKDTLLLRTIAIFLITNSHLDLFYPVKALGTGGSLGNSLFFMLSGLGLALSWKKREKADFWSWYLRRIARVYLPVITFVFLYPFLMAKGWATWTLDDYLKNFIFAEDYWFIFALLVFYIFIFPVFKYRLTNSKSIQILLSILGISYIVAYLMFVDLGEYSIEKNNYFRWIFYFMIMLVGVHQASWYSRNKSEGNCRDVSMLLKYVGLLFANVGAYFGFLLLMERFGFYQFQFLIHLLTFSFVWLALRIVCHQVIGKLLEQKVIGFMVTLIGSLTLEIYLTQRPIRFSESIETIVFPLNIIVFSVLTLLAAYCLRQVVNLLRYGPTSLGGIRIK
jgi:peptidoglycan/LPS O-acetylase OafA/YrhL